MATPSTEQFIDALQHAPLSELQRNAIWALYSFPGHEATAGQVAALLGYSSHSPANNIIGNAARVISQYTGILPPHYAFPKAPSWFSVISVWDGVACTWRLLPELVAAIQKTQLDQDALLDFHADDIAEDVAEDEPLREGMMFSVMVNLYERSALARRKCIEHYGCSCWICGFSFEFVYGELGRDYIHVHHVIPLAEINAEYVVDPVRDLRPVCPNCHAMLHRTSPVLFVEELKRSILRNPRIS